MESVLFVSGEAISINDIADGLNISIAETEQVIIELMDYYIRNNRGIRLKKFGNKVQLHTYIENAKYIENVMQPIQKQSISSKTLEALAIIAYKQPVTKNEIEQIRGVKSDYSISSLLAKGLIANIGTKDTVGNPILYGTTDAFLSHFGIDNLSALPPLLPLEELNINNE